MRRQIIGFDEDAPLPRDDNPILFWSLFTLSLLVVAWFYAAPYITFYQLRQAAKEGDAEALSELVNFPAVKESLKEAFKASLTQAVMKDKQGGMMAVLGLIFGSAIGESMIDVLISPTSIEALTHGKKPDLAKAKPSSGMDESGKELPLYEDVANAIMGKAEVNFAYDGVSKFSARWPDKKTGKDAIVLILRRENVFWWRLNAVRMPILFDKPK
jgi:hypothetical protein